MLGISANIAGDRGYTMTSKGRLAGDNGHKPRAEEQRYSLAT
jgi:hypothetical protein